jgi:hypothetical protein
VTARCPNLDKLERIDLAIVTTLGCRWVQEQQQKHLRGWFRNVVVGVVVVYSVSLFFFFF